MDRPVDAGADLHAVRQLLQRTISALQTVMGERQPSRALQHGLAMLWAVADSLDDLRGAEDEASELRYA